jgi:uncharacterized protein (DUF433 family)
MVTKYRVIETTGKVSGQNTILLDEPLTDIDQTKIRIMIWLEPEIIKTPGVCGGDARIRNTRIPIWTLVSLKKQGESDDDLLKNYPTLTKEDLQNAWKYYEVHHDEIENNIKEQDEAFNNEA